jgi:hypothetical protein
MDDVVLEMGDETMRYGLKKIFTKTAYDGLSQKYKDT